MNQVMPRLHATVDMLNGNFRSKDIVSLDQFTQTDLQRLFTVTREM